MNNPSVLDMQWGFFFATGDIEPIRHLVTSFSLSKHKGAMDRYKTSQAEKDKQEALLDVTFQAAQWSLHSNCLQHPLVLEHCEKMLAEGKLPKDQEHWLTVVLAKIKPDKYQPKPDPGTPKTDI